MAKLAPAFAAGTKELDTYTRTVNGKTATVRKAPRKISSDQSQADATGQGVTAVNKSRNRAKNIPKPLRDQIAGTRLDVGKELDALAKVEEAAQPAVIETMSIRDVGSPIDITLM